MIIVRALFSATIVTLLSACTGNAPAKNTQAVQVVEGTSTTVIVLDNLLTPIGSGDGGQATVRYGVSMTFDYTIKKEPFIGNNDLGPLKSLADDAMKRFTLEQVNDKDFGKAYAAELQQQLKANVKGTNATEVELLWMNVEQRVEEPSNSGKCDPSEDAWLELEGLATPVAAASGKTSTVRYGLLIHFSGSLTEQAETMASWEQSGNKNILRAFADDVMKKYDLDRVRDESFKRVYAEELRKTINLQISDKVEKIVVTELRHD